jgi:hypothetical protein
MESVLCPLIFMRITCGAPVRRMFRTARFLLVEGTLHNVDKVIYLIRFLLRPSGKKALRANQISRLVTPEGRFASAVASRDFCGAP